MVLQHIAWPSEPETTEKELYYHGAPNYTGDGKLLIKAGETLKFDTYFNSFLSKSWLQYTKVGQIIFRIAIAGQGTVRLIGTKGGVISEQPFEGEQELGFTARTEDSPYFYLGIHAETESVLEWGCIETDEPGQAVKLALVTCTYNRQEEIKRNIALLNHQNKLNTKNPVLEQIYVVDNAGNLEKGDIGGDRIRLIPNRNTGGAGGFTRGLEEAIKRRELTHIILMDDDVRIEFEAFRRTKAFLSYIKPEYAGHFLGGAMLREDVPYMLHAAGEDWADGHIQNPYKGKDMRAFQNVIGVSEPVETKQAYAGWWYCCIPREHVEQKGYPMPFFLHCDDVEYSLRSGKPPIYLNGIAVWHEEFEDKRSSVMEYYDTRNRLIVNAIYKAGKRRWNAETIIWERFLACILRYRYKDIDLIIQAVDDFLKGAKWIKNLESGEYHKKLMDIGYRLIPIEKTGLIAEEKNISRFVTVLRYFAPAHGIGTIRLGSLVSSYAGKKEVVLIDTKKQVGIIVRKSWRETLIYVGRVIKCSIRMHLAYKRKIAGWEDLARLN